MAGLGSGRPSQACRHSRHSPPVVSHTMRNIDLPQGARGNICHPTSAFPGHQLNSAAHYCSLYTFNNVKQTFIRCYSSRQFDVQGQQERCACGSTSTLYVVLDRYMDFQLTHRFRPLRFAATSSSDGSSPSASSTSCRSWTWSSNNGVVTPSYTSGG